MAFRTDAIRLDASKITKTGSGAIRVPAMITRSDVFDYTDASGKTVREWRPPEEVLKADSLATLKDLPVTDRHPKGFVTPETWRGVSIGHTSGDARADAAGAGVEHDLVIADGRAVPRVGKDLLEVSCGYQCKIDEAPGVVPQGYPGAGKPYDRIQRDITYNHVAVGPKDWGRQGNAVSMRLDSKDDEIAPDAREDAPPVKEIPKMFKVRFDGKDHEFKTEAEAQAFIDGLAGRLDAADKLAKKEKERADAAPALAAAQLKSRAELEQTARKVLGADARFDAKDANGLDVPLTDRAIKVLVIQKTDSEFKDAGQPEAFIDGQYAAYVKAIPAPAGRADAATAVLASALSGVGPDGKRTDSATEAERVDAGDHEAAQARSQQRKLDAANKPRKMPWEGR